MKFNWAVFKKGKPIYWLVGAIVLFVIFYMITSKGAGQAESGTGGDVYAYNPGTSDAQSAVSAQIAMAQISANADTNRANLELAAIREQGASQVALGQLAANVSLAETQAGADVAKYQTMQDANIANASLTAQTAIAEMQGEYTLETARVVSQADLQAKSIDAAVLTHQLDVNRAMVSDQLNANIVMFHEQSENLTKQAVLSVIPTLKKKNRDDVLRSIAPQLLN